MQLAQLKQSIYSDPRRSNSASNLSQILSIDSDVPSDRPILESELQSNKSLPKTAQTTKENTEFHDLFKNIDDDEFLIAHYSCALAKDVLVQGRLWISEHHVAFRG